MLELMKFIFSSFWHYIGTLILILVILEGVADIVKAIRNNHEKGDENDDKSER